MSRPWTLWLAWLVACGSPTAAQRPSEEPPAHAAGTMVKAGPVEGYLVRPAEGIGPWPGVLLLPSTLDAAARVQADALAAGGHIVLAIGPEENVVRAERYLATMPSTTSTRRVCGRTTCP